MINLLNIIIIIAFSYYFFSLDIFDDEKNYKKYISKEQLVSFDYIFKVLLSTIINLAVSGSLILFFTYVSLLFYSSIDDFPYMVIFLSIIIYPAIIFRSIIRLIKNRDKDHVIFSTIYFSAVLIIMIFWTYIFYNSPTLIMDIWHFIDGFASRLSGD